jgi:hypothetical protein
VTTEYWVGSSHTRCGVYHTDDECPYLTEKHRRVEQDWIDHRPELEECVWCAGEFEPHNGGNARYQDLADSLGVETDG